MRLGLNYTSFREVGVNVYQVSVRLGLIIVIPYQLSKKKPEFHEISRIFHEHFTFFSTPTAFSILIFDEKSCSHILPVTQSNFTQHTCRAHTSLQKSLPAKKKRLSKAQAELTALTEKWEGLRKEVGVARSNVEDAKSFMQANQSKLAANYSGTPLIQTPMGQKKVSILASFACKKKRRGVLIRFAHFGAVLREVSSFQGCP